MLGQKIGRYLVQEELGHGAMAAVYLALDPAMKRQVAVKVLTRSLSTDPEFRGRFGREAEVIARLEHPYIVPVYDFGEHGAQPYIVMRYMPGGSLAVRLRSGPLPTNEAAQIVERIAVAVDAAHRAGIIHRDLKPENVLFDRRGDPFLSDFGIVRIVTGDGLTSGGTIAGTPAYMSPEQVHGDEAVDGRADIYALGVTLFQMLTGRTPYQADQATRMMMKHVMEPVPNILEARADLPPGFEGVIRRAMAKQPDDRYQTAGEMAEAVTMLTPKRLSKRARRRLTADDISALYDTIEDE
jgi:serine/threonine protein kinase